MTAHALKTVLAQLPLLSKAERQTVRSRLDLLGSSPVEGPAAELYQWLRHLLGGHGWPPLSVILRSRHGKAFRTGSETFAEFVAETFGPVPLRTRQRLYVLLLDCLLTDLKEAGQRPTPYTVSRSLSSIYYIVDRCFPGYMSSGLLSEALADGGAKWERSQD